MARPRKEAMDYFPLNTQLDEKFEMIEDTYKSDGFTVVIKAFQSIYLTPKGELDISNVLRRTTYAKRAHVSLERWEEIIAAAVEVELFDKKKFAAGILTSNGIKKRIAKIRSFRAKKRERYSEFRPSETPAKLGRNLGETGETKQNKTKQNKREEEDAREARSTLPPSVDSQIRDEAQLSLSEWRNHLRQQGKNFTPEAEQALIDSYARRDMRDMIRNIRFSMSRCAKNIVEAPREFKAKRRAPKAAPEEPLTPDPKVLDLVGRLGEGFSMQVTRKEAGQ